MPVIIRGPCFFGDDDSAHVWSGWMDQQWVVAPDGDRVFERSCLRCGQIERAE